MQERRASSTDLTQSCTVRLSNRSAMAQTADDIDHCCSRSLTALGRSKRSSLPSREKGFESTTDGVVLSGERVPASTAKCCGNVAADAQTASTELRPPIKVRTNVDCIPAPTVNVAITT